jgi:hypothetical protein
MISPIVSGLPRMIGALSGFGTYHSTAILVSTDQLTEKRPV